MQVQDVPRLREAADALIAAVADLDPAATAPAAYQDLWALGDRLEAIGRTLVSEAAARLPDGTARDDDGPDRLSHPLRRVDA
ncbi:MAG TPA: hypothetical protein VFI44_06920 [Ornithinibacter sp.]|nr:hypothetical protein [Ornithinibacter sp.]